MGIITAICPYVGYDKASIVAKEAIETGRPIQEIILREKLISEEALEKILNPYAMTEPGKSGM